jgi:hypothetical protein
VSTGLMPVLHQQRVNLSSQPITHQRKRNTRTSVQGWNE